MPAAYGYIRGYGVGADGDHPDVYLTNVTRKRSGAYLVHPEGASPVCYIIDQVDPVTGEFDEHKIILGTADMAEAMAIYDRGFSDGSGPARMQGIYELPVECLKRWLTEGNLGEPFQSQYGAFHVDAIAYPEGVEEDTNRSTKERFT
jgi:hypothetical protein